MSRLRALSPVAIILVISLVANALLIGLVAGNMLGKPRGDGGPPGGPRGGGEDFMLARGLENVVPEAARTEMREAFRDAFRKSRGLWQQKREAREALTAALAAEPFDPARVDAAFEAMREADRALTARFQTELSQQFEGLTAEQRAELVSWLRDMEERRAKWRERRREDRRPPPD